MAERNPWGDLPGSPPYVLPMDKEAIVAYERKPAVATARQRYGLHTELPPVPFIGDPQARLVILALNPGYAAADIRDFAEPAFQRAALLNLTHIAEGLAFFPIAPQFRATSTYRFWYPKLRPLIDNIGLDAVAKGTLCLQLHPYHSRRFYRGIELPSQAYTVGLLRDRLRAGATIVVLWGKRERSKRDWEKTVPEFRSYPGRQLCISPDQPVLNAASLSDYDAARAALTDSAV